jgi:hypothetical protein
MDREFGTRQGSNPTVPERRPIDPNAEDSEMIPRADHPSPLQHDDQICRIAENADFGTFVAMLEGDYA